MTYTSYCSTVNLTGTGRNIFDARLVSKGYVREEKFLVKFE
jgi:hypothetical protein